MKNTMEIDGYRAIIQFDPDIDMFRGEFIGLNGGADFYAPDVAGLRKEGALSLKVFPRDVPGGRRRTPTVVLGQIQSAYLARVARERGGSRRRGGKKPQSSGSPARLARSCCERQVTPCPPTQCPPRAAGGGTDPERPPHKKRPPVRVNPR